MSVGAASNVFSLQLLLFIPSVLRLIVGFVAAVVNIKNIDFFVFVETMITHNFAQSWVRGPWVL